MTAVLERSETKPTSVAITWFEDEVPSVETASAVAVSSLSRLKAIELERSWKAKVRVMNLVATAFGQEDEQTSDISAQFVDGFLAWTTAAGPAPLEHEYGTALSVSKFSTQLGADRTKDRLYSQLCQQDEATSAYTVEDGSRVVEFAFNPSKMVAIFDDSGVQLLWHDREVRFESIANSGVDMDKLAQKVALILHLSSAAMDGDNTRDQAPVAIA